MVLGLGDLGVPIPRDPEAGHHPEVEDDWTHVGAERLGDHGRHQTDPDEDGESSRMNRVDDAGQYEMSQRRRAVDRQERLDPGGA
jgi:hypothetical protein